MIIRDAAAQQASDFFDKMRALRQELRKTPKRISFTANPDGTRSCVEIYEAHGARLEIVRAPELEVVTEVKEVVIFNGQRHTFLNLN